MVSVVKVVGYHTEERTSHSGQEARNSGPDPSLTVNLQVKKSRVKPFQEWYPDDVTSLH